MSRPPRPTSSSRSNCSGGDFDWEPALRKLDELNARVEDPTLWDDAAAAQAITRERSKLAASVEAVQSLERDLADAVGYAEMADEEGDEASLDEARAQLKAIKERAARAELEALLSGEADGNDAFVEINSGAGGTESNDWAGMLMRMYTRWASAHGMSVDFLEETSGEQAGIKSVTLQIKGPNAYGWLKTEAGVHRRRCAYRHLPRLRRRRSAYQQDRLGRAPDPRSDGRGGGLSDGALAAPEPRGSLEDAARASL